VAFDKKLLSPSIIRGPSSLLDVSLLAFLNYFRSRETSSNRMQSRRGSCINAVIATEYDKHGSYRFVGNGNYAESPEAMREMATILRAWGDAELLASNLIAIIMLV